MTDVQDRLLTLTDEIDEICTEAGLRYFLADGTAIAAYKKGGYTADEYEMKLIMPLSDMKQFIDLALAKHGSDREIETPSDNAYMSVPCIRYVDKNSLLVDYSSMAYFKKPGIALTIFPLFPELPKHLRERIKAVMETNRCEIETEILIEKQAEEKADKKPDKKSDKKDEQLEPVNVTEEVPQIINALRDMKFSRNDCIYYIDQKKKFRRISDKESGIYDQNDRIEFFGHSYSAPGEKYFTLRYGRDIEKINYSPLPGTGRIRVIADTDMPYSEFNDFTRGKGADPLEIKHKRRSYLSWKKAVLNPMSQKTTHVLDEVKRSRDRIDVWMSLRDKRDELKKAKEAGDVDTLKKTLKTYLKKTDDYYKKKIGFYIDDELFSYAKEVWQAEEKPDDYADKVYALVPDLYKTETPDEYFSKRKARGKMI